MVKVVNAQAPCRASRGARLYSTIAKGVGFTTTLCPRDPHSRVRWGDLFARAWPASARTRGDGNEDLTGLHFPFAWTWSLLVRSARLRLILCALTRCIVILLQVCDVCRRKLDRSDSDSNGAKYHSRCRRRPKWALERQSSHLYACSMYRKNHSVISAASSLLP